MKSQQINQLPTQATESVARFFHSYAAEFDSIYGGRSSTFQRFVDRAFRRCMILRFLRVVEEVGKPNIKSVLDVGCGSGRYALEYLKLGKRVIGIDLAQGMLDLAQKACERDFKNGSFTFRQGDYLEMPLQEQCDAAVLIGFFDYIPNPQSVFLKLKKEVRHVILASFPKAGGVLGLQRRVRYYLRGVPLFLYCREDIDNVIRSADVRSYEISDLGRDFFVKLEL